MEIDVYCDEAYPDLFSSTRPQAKFMILGSLWLQTDSREGYKQAIHDLRDRYLIGGEFKWRKVTPSKIDFYKSLISWFYDQKDNLRFRCIAIDYSQVDLMKFHDNDQELGFYKFYYQMIHHWIHDFNEYAMFCDFKSNRRRDRLNVLQQCLAHSNLSATIKIVQAVRSKESVLIQLTDLLIGIVSARLNQGTNTSPAKLELLKHLETLLGRKISSTPLNEKKINVFKINLNGGW
jgi:hypothetical protein